ncbi:MAG: ATP-binding cassette domain-containing protein [Verrucomicrobia bacterium]|nr:ATP-binding cassette domain-containing protein [Verrucomicrobiota bacterium]
MLKPNEDSSTPVLEVFDVTKTYPNGRTVLKGISFQVYPRETFVILGGSGCGKSTLLNILTGILQPTSGEVRVFGQQLHSLSPKALTAVHLRCGMMFQFGALLESLSLLENVCLPLKQHIHMLRDEVLEETGTLKLRMVGMEAHASKRPSAISGGMKKRVALARALALDPDLVFADEPTSGLDPVSTEEVDELLTRLTQRIGAAAVVVTHDIKSFYRIADRAILLGGERDGDQQGQVIFGGSKQEFLDSKNSLVRRFIGLTESSDEVRNEFN